MQGSPRNNLSFEQEAAFSAGPNSSVDDQSLLLMFLPCRTLAVVPELGLHHLASYESQENTQVIYCGFKCLRISVCIQHNNYIHYNTHLKTMKLTVVLSVCSFECLPLGPTPSFSSSSLKARIFVELSTSLMAGAESGVDTNFINFPRSTQHCFATWYFFPCPLLLVR